MSKLEIIEEKEEKDELKNLIVSERNVIPSKTSRQNSMIINSDMKYFKNDLLKEIKISNQELFSKFTQYSLELNEKMKKVSQENRDLDNKIEYIANKVDSKLNIFLSEKGKYNIERMINDIRETKITNEIRIKAMREDLKIHKDQYDDIIRNNILYQGMIGPGCKYKNLHQFFDYLISSLNELITINNQKAGEMNSYKNKVDNILRNINNQISDIKIEYKSYVKEYLKDFEENIKKEIKLYDDKLFELKTQNIQNTKNIEEKLDTFNTKYNSLEQIENTINESNEKIIDDLKKSNLKLNQMLEEYKKELDNLKEKYNELLDSHNEIKEKVSKINLPKLKDIFNFRNKNIYIKKASKTVQDFSNNDNYKISEMDTGSKRYKNQSTETIIPIVNKTEKKIPINKGNFESIDEISKVYLKMDKDKSNRKISKKILRNERLEKFKFLYENDININDNNILTKSIDNSQIINDENNSLNKAEKRIKSSKPIHSKKKDKKKFIENYSSRDLYDTGLLVNFNSIDEENAYINNLKSNALCLKLLEKGIKIDKKYFNDYINKSAINPGDYFFNSKNLVKERSHNSRNVKNIKNVFNKGKVRNSNFENNKFQEYQPKGENYTGFLLKNNNNENSFKYRNQNNKIKIKNLSAII